MAIPSLPSTLTPDPSLSNLDRGKFYSFRGDCSSPRYSSTQMVPSGSNDLTDLPPAKGLSKSLSALTNGLESNVVLVQAAEWAQSKKLIPDLSTWVQCFAIYAVVVLSAQPHRATSIVMYMYHIAKLSKQFQWPSWIIYVHLFRELAAATGNQDWSNIEPSMYTTSFTNQMIKSPGW